jgi:hypothetical protein
MLELGIVSSEADVLSFFENPERYKGLAAQKAKSIAQKYKKLMEV